MPKFLPMRSHSKPSVLRLQNMQEILNEKHG